MDGKCWKALAVASLLAASAGCRGTGSKTMTSGIPTPPAAGGGNAVSRLFQPKPAGPPPQYQASEQPINESDLKKGPLKAETVAALANAQVGAAFDFQADGTANPNLDRLADDARQKFQKALEQDPKNHEALQGLARLYTRLGDRERAISTLQTMQSYYPTDHKIAYETALTYARFDDWANGVTACRAALAGDPENRRYQKTLGILTARTGNFEDGYALIASVTTEAEARMTMAKLLVDMDRTDLAEAQVQIVMKIDPNLPQVQEWINARPGSAVQPVQHAEPANR